MRSKAGLLAFPHRVEILAKVQGDLRTDRRRDDSRMRVDESLERRREHRDFNLKIFTIY